MRREHASGEAGEGTGRLLHVRDEQLVRDVTTGKCFTGLISVDHQRDVEADDVRDEEPAEGERAFARSSACSGVAEEEQLVDLVDRALEQSIIARKELDREPERPGRSGA